jgi:L-ascorbate metabolism protein UlaG (beta-lactamase superfamily)
MDDGAWWFRFHPRKFASRSGDLKPPTYRYGDFKSPLLENFPPRRDVFFMKFTYYGHACFAVEAAGKTLLFDPFISPNPLAKEIDMKKVAADFVLVSHGHGDHVADAADIANRTGATMIAPFEVGSWFAGKGVKNVQAMNHGGAAKMPFGRVKLTSAIHSSSMPDGSYGGNPCGFVVETAEGNFYYSGDTALTMDMKLIGELTDLRFAVFPIGDFFTMGIDDALRAAEFAGVTKFVGVHYDTFPPIKLDRERALKAAKTAGIELLLPAIGEMLDL